MHGLSVGDAAAVLQHEQWLRSINRSEVTIIGRTGLLIRLARWLAELDPPKELVTATQLDLAAWQRGLAKFGPESVANYVNHAKQFFVWRAKFHGAEDVGVLLVRPRRHRGKPRPIANDLLREALVLAPARTRRILLCGAFLGARCIEIARLQVTDLHHRDPVPAALLHGKGGVDRLVRLPGGFMAAMTQAGMSGGGWVVSSEGNNPGRPLSANRVSQIMNRYLRSLGIYDTGHSLRHWFGSTGYQITRDLRTVQEAMGHESATTTALYTLPDSAASDEMAAGLDKVLVAMLGTGRHMRVVR